jgi:uncharacterized protein YxeA
MNKKVFILLSIVLLSIITLSILLFIKEDTSINNSEVERLKNLALVENSETLYRDIMNTVEKLEGYKDSSVSESFTFFDTTKAIPFVPEGATIVEFWKHDKRGSVAIGYSFDNLRFALMLFEDGTIRKEVYNKAEDIIVSRTNNGKPDVKTQLDS